MVCKARKKMFVLDISFLNLKVFFVLKINNMPNIERSKTKFKYVTRFTQGQ